MATMYLNDPSARTRIVTRTEGPDLNTWLV